MCPRKELWYAPIRRVEIRLRDTDPRVFGPFAYALIVSAGLVSIHNGRRNVVRTKVMDKAKTDPSAVHVASDISAVLTVK